MYPWTLFGIYVKAVNLMLCLSVSAIKYIILICVGYRNFVADLSKIISNRKFLKTNMGQSVSHYMLSCPLYQISVSSCELLNIIQTVLLISHWPERAVLLKSRHHLRYSSDVVWDRRSYDKTGLRPKNRSWSWSCTLWSWSCRSDVVLWNMFLLRSSS